MQTTEAPLRLASLGIRGQDTAHVLAVLIDRSPLPVTALIGGMARTRFRLAVIRTGQRGLSAGEAHLLDAPEGTPCRWRTGQLETAAGELAAGVSLLWLPGRLDAGTCAELDAAREPAGTILGRLPGGMRRERRRAAAASVVDKITGEDCAVMSRAVLVVNGQPAGIAEENWTAPFVSSLA